LFTSTVLAYVRQSEVEDDQVVLIDLAEVDTVFPQVGREDIEPSGFQHQFDAASDLLIILDQQDPHYVSPESRLPCGGVINHRIRRAKG
jgi:hypothetical protein